MLRGEVGARALRVRSDDYMCPGYWLLILDLMTRVVFFFRFNAEASHCMSEEAWIK